LSRHLTLLLADISEVERGIKEVYDEWAKAEILNCVALIDVNDASRVLEASTQWIKDGIYQSQYLKNVVMDELWSGVSLVSLRMGEPDAYEPARFKREESVAEFIQSAFTKCPVHLITIGLAEEGKPPTEEMLSPRWDLHLVHGPKIILDSAAAILKINEYERPEVCLLLAAVAAGGLRWQDEILADTVNPFKKGIGPVRLARLQLRVLDAGPVYTDILAGAFPESGPWTSPLKEEGMQAPIGALVSDQVVGEVVSAGAFSCQTFTPPPEPKATSIGILGGLGLFFRNFMKALKSTPFILVDGVATKLGEKVATAAQKLTFGNGSAVVIEFRPNAPKEVVQQALQQLKISGMPGVAPAVVSDPTPWKVLQRTSLSLLDGGDFPQGVAAPLQGGKRLVYVDPVSVSPAPSSERFVLNPFESEILGLPDNPNGIDALDVADALAIAQAINDRMDPKSTPLFISDGEYKKKEVVISAITLDEAEDLAMHDPSHSEFAPTSYGAICAFYQGPEGDAGDIYAELLPLFEEASEKHESINGFWSKNESCDRCGNEFDHGVLFIHEPSEELLHLGYICARNNGMPRVEADPTDEIVREISLRWDTWHQLHSGGFLWRVGKHIVESSETARENLAAAFASFEIEPTHSISEDEETRVKLQKWTARSFLASITFSIVGVVAVITSFVIPFVGIGIGLPAVLTTGFVMVSTLLVRLAVLTRDLARLQTRLTSGDRERSVALLRIEHFSSEFARMNNALEQFDDWQAMIRIISHTPFGALGEPKEGVKVVVPVTRPQSFVFATTQPLPKQLIKAQLTARKMTIHKGWLSTVFDGVKEEWSERYKQSLLLDMAQEPERDNSPYLTVQGRDSSNQEILTPRQDFRKRLTDEFLQEVVVREHKKTIVEWIRETPIDELLGPIQIIGSGVALNGMNPHQFLRGIFLAEEDEPLFDGDLFSLKDGLGFIANNVERVIDSGDETVYSFSVFDIRGLERGLVYATFRLVLSPPLPPGALKDDGNDGPPDPEPTSFGPGEPPNRDTGGDESPVV
jgi:hypothetical protein